MKVNFELSGKVGFFIEPETDFEADMIGRVFQRKSGVDGYVKCGVTPAEVQGLRVYSAWWDCTSSAKEENKSSTQQPKVEICASSPCAYCEDVGNPGHCCSCKNYDKFNGRRLSTV